jgi:hypothetical protein
LTIASHELDIFDMRHGVQRKAQTYHRSNDSTRRQFDNSAGVARNAASRSSSCEFAASCIRTTG